MLLFLSMDNKFISETIIKLNSNSKHTLEIFLDIPKNQRALILTHLEPKSQLIILNNLKTSKIIEILNFLDPDKITDILQNLPENKQQNILKKLNKKKHEKVEFLLKFDAKTAAGIMSLDYIEVEKNIKFKELGELIQKHESRTGKVPAILVVENNYLIGELPGHNLAIAKKSQKIEKFITPIPSIRDDANRDDVLNLFKHNSHSKIVVLDEDFGIVGIIYSDDVLRLLHKHSLKHLGKFAGVSEEEDVLDSFKFKVKYRYKWLIINLFTMFLAASVVNLFKETIAAYTLLVIYMPIVAGMGGNAGTQTLAVMVRGIALKQVDLKIGKQVIFKEMIAGLFNGLITGLIISLVAYLWHKNVLIGLVLGLSVIINLIVAGLFGSVIPLIMKSLGKDPATSATIFITTATDVFGFFAFLGLATLVL